MQSDRMKLANAWDSVLQAGMAKLEPKADPDNPLFPPEVRARLRVSTEQAERNVREIRARMGDKLDTFTPRIEAVIRSREPVWVRLRQLYALADEMNSYNGDNVACRRGCNHCCHIAVVMIEPEAKMLGARLRIKPKDVARKYREFDIFSYNYHTPCPFLKQGECSIYADRPLACRNLVNADIDDLLCHMMPSPPQPTVPYLNRVPFDVAYVAVCQSQRVADIREYFPQGLPP
jgi:hypothetical protein